MLLTPDAGALRRLLLAQVQLLPKPFYLSRINHVETVADSGYYCNESGAVSDTEGPGSRRALHFPARRCLGLPDERKMDMAKHNAEALLDEIIAVIEENPEGESSIPPLIEGPAKALAKIAESEKWPSAPVLFCEDHGEIDRFIETLSDQERGQRIRIASNAIGVCHLQFSDPVTIDTVAIRPATFDADKKTGRAIPWTFKTGLIGEKRTRALAMLKGWKRWLKRTEPAGVALYTIGPGMTINRNGKPSDITPTMLKLLQLLESHHSVDARDICQQVWDDRYGVQRRKSIGKFIRDDLNPRLLSVNLEASLSGDHILIKATD